MAQYTKEEIITATDVVRNFSAVLQSISSKQKEKLVIVKNNRFEAVLLSVDEYEKMCEAVAILQKIYDKKR
ncbi:MAG: type II toxin-antitoxin system Phd/YefM family antitoxin [Sulfurospirillum sp.]|nr:type II toxin-antitoxin system Phd/YefM family antitoxin [Sulfurospirillum sp.]